jgi:hypothetical protein
LLRVNTISISNKSSVFISQKSAELCDSAIGLVSQFIQATVRQPTAKEKQKDEQPPLGIAHCLMYSQRHCLFGKKTFINLISDFRFYACKSLLKTLSCEFSFLFLVYKDELKFACAVLLDNLIDARYNRGTRGCMHLIPRLKVTSFKNS